jgi:hypothetical protein
MNLFYIILIACCIFIIIEILGIFYFNKKRAKERFMEQFNQSTQVSIEIQLIMITTLLLMATFFMILIFNM